MLALKKMFISAALLISSQWLQAAELMDTISQKLAETSKLQSSFTQTRQLAALKKPLVIQGHMVFAREQGVLWKIEKPYRMTYIMTAKGVREIQADGSHKDRAAADIPGIGSVEGLFRGILTAERDILAHHFSAKTTGDINAWTLSLLPKNATLQKVLKEVTLEGGDQVRAVRIQEINGDDTTITFSELEPLKELTKEDAALLALNVEPKQR